MIGHPFSKMLVEFKRLKKRLREKLDKRFASKPNLINIVRPINKKTAPDHDPKNGKVDPMKPANSQRMFLLDFFHSRLNTNGRYKILRKIGSFKRQNP